MNNLIQRYYVSASTLNRFLLSLNPTTSCTRFHLSNFFSLYHYFSLSITFARIEMGPPPSTLSFLHARSSLCNAQQIFQLRLESANKNLSHTFPWHTHNHLLNIKFNTTRQYYQSINNNCYLFFSLYIIK